MTGKRSEIPYHSPIDLTDKPSMLGKPLTDRELAVCKLAATGLTNKQIGIELHITEGTVKCHLFIAYAKRGWKNRVDMTRWLTLESVETA